MEECNALCTRLTIMKDGAFMCLGSPQHLKNSFKKGFKLILTARNDNPETISGVQSFMAARFPTCFLVDMHHTTIVYKIPCGVMNWSRLFHVLEQAKAKHMVDNYSICQTNLEDIFINIAQNPESRQPSNMTVPIMVTNSEETLSSRESSNTILG